MSARLRLPSLLAALALVLSVAAPVAQAAPSRIPLPARGTAFADEDKGSVGVFAPLHWKTGHETSVRVHPLLFLVSPNLEVQSVVKRGPRWAVALEGALSVPTLALRLSRGYLFPTEAQIPWALVGRGGLLASHGDPRGNVATLSADGAVNLTRDLGLSPLGAPAPLELLLAPVVSGSRLRVGLAYDAALSNRFRARGYADVYRHAAGLLSPWTFRMGAAADMRVGVYSRFTFGLVYFNQDQGRVDAATGERRRNHDIYPTVDFIWAWR